MKLLFLLIKKLIADKPSTCVFTKYDLLYSESIRPFKLLNFGGQEGEGTGKQCYQFLSEINFK